VIRTSLEKLRQEAAAKNRKQQQKIRNSRISGSRSCWGVLARGGFSAPIRGILQSATGED